MKILSKLVSFDCTMILLFAYLWLIGLAAENELKAGFFYALSVFVGVSFMVTGKIVETIKESKGE